MERHTVEVSFEGELLATHTDERGASRLYRSKDGSLYVYWRDEEGAWLESGQPGRGVPPALIASWWPELVGALEA